LMQINSLDTKAFYVGVSGFTTGELLRSSFSSLPVPIAYYKT
jgi:hypothetical protein